MTRILCACLLLANICYAQSDNLYLHAKGYQLLDRLDIMLTNDTILGFTTVKPYNRKDITERIEYLDSLQQANPHALSLSAIDRYNMKRMLLDNSEWTRHYTDSFLRKPLLKHFYQSPAHMYMVNTPVFTLRVEPLLYLQYGKANDGTPNLYQNSRGLLLRGNIGKRISFYQYVTDTQERDPQFVQDWITKHDAVPGAGFYKPYKNGGYDYFDMKGGFSFKAARYFDIQFAYDKLFIGNGYRSLYISDFSNNYLFMRLRTRIWKLDYEMIIAQTIQSVPQKGREMKPVNYMAIHHLSIQLAKWLNLGIYENIMEDGKYGLQLSYLNPVIFYRAAESNLGAAGKCNIGIDLKSNIGRKVQLYGQLLINEFQIKDVMHYSSGAYANKHAFQLGGKYINALGIRNLDIQVEANLIRPFTYTNFDSVTNLTHYHQPLAHPLGASVREYIALLHYQPLKRLYLSAKLAWFKQGLDSAGVNMGGDIFRSYLSRTRSNGYFIGSGIPVTSLTANASASWELFENMFFDFSVTHRNYNVQAMPRSAVFFYMAGLRINMAKRTFDF
ncbi:hypothetical protein SAMN05421788_104323 [Filimonas lacunae]|uniref:Capsule assembly protein Wzi n=1 Tax=Filimonas lacunae TaxID=477680 RepID=A0A173MS09_9BACT|nr:hypothetical protein [Filimonas lacunae]BAV10306.1 hypothetical protein FLA_6368 [Filimonas lacunae]SIT17261.1 hypothetical protein SAMN05421788_104323 [Filimonas lacunae]